MIFLNLVPPMCAFLSTYLLHSTLLLILLGVMLKCRWLTDHGLRIILMKAGLLVPVCTALATAVVDLPRWSWQFPIHAWSAEYTRQTEDPADDDVSPAPGRLATTQKLRRAISEPVPHTGYGAEEFASGVTGEFPESPLRSNHAGMTMNWQSSGIVILSIGWLCMAAAGMIRLGVQWRNLQQLRTTASPVSHVPTLNELERLRQLLGIRQPVVLLTSHKVAVAMAAGITHPFIVFPAHTQLADSGEQRRAIAAMLAHELAHIARKDAVWNLLIQLICRAFVLQPLNWRLGQALRHEMDFCADRMAMTVLGDRMSLVQCLYATGKQVQHRRKPDSPAQLLASGIAHFQSVLGQRVAALINDDECRKQPSAGIQRCVSGVMLLLAVSICVFAPRVVVQAADSPASISGRNETMNRKLTPLIVFAALSVPATADEPATDNAQRKSAAVALSTTPDELPEGIRRFNGMLVGRVAAKDVEQGSFIVAVDAVPRVWENSRAENPRSIVGKTIKVSGVFGRFLDVLVVTRVGETIEFECKHDGEGLVFPGELLRKVAAFDPEDYPVLPEDFRGFRGEVAAEILRKDPETFELILRVDRILKTWEKNEAKDAKSIEGKSLMLAGFWNRRDEYHALKAGDRIEVGMRHIVPRSDHLTVTEDVRRPGTAKQAPEADDKKMSERDPETEPNLQRGFRGLLVGRLMEKDVERGTFAITVDAVPRVWQNNRAGNPKALIGTTVSAEGVTGRMLDALVVSKVGDTIEFGALHEEGPRVRVGEVLRKVGPVKPGDYPELPDEFRGFRGVVVAKVIRKGDESWDLVIEVEEIQETLEGSKAKTPSSIVGKQVMLAGFWNRKEDFHRIQAGDRIRCGMHHQQLLSDHVNVAEAVSKVEEE